MPNPNATRAFDAIFFYKREMIVHKDEVFTIKKMSVKDVPKVPEGTYRRILVINVIRFSGKMNDKATMATRMDDRLKSELRIR
jgi:hypothetical protein